MVKNKEVFAEGRAFFEWWCCWNQTESSRGQTLKAIHRWVSYGVTCPVYNAGLSFRQPQDLLHTWHGRPHPGDDFDPRGGIEKGHHSHLLWHDNLWICTLRKLPQGSTCMQKCVKTTQSHTDNIFVCRRNIFGYSICMSHKTSAELHLHTLGTFCFVWYGRHKLKKHLFMLA